MNFRLILIKGRNSFLGRIDQLFDMGKGKVFCIILLVIFLLAVAAIAVDSFVYNFLPWFDVWALITGSSALS